MPGRVGAIPTEITLAALQSVRRNAADDDFEAYTPGTGGGIPDGDYGDITVSGGGTVMTLDAGVGGLTQPQVMARTLGC